MQNSQHTDGVSRLVLQASVAADLMTSNPVSIEATAPVREAVAFLTDKGFSAAPVIDRGGRPIGVLSRADIVVHDRNKVQHLVPAGTSYDESERVPGSEERLRDGFQVEDVDYTEVRDIMTPIVFSVRPDTPAVEVVEDLLGLQVHRLFVVDKDGVLTGVISAHDILRHLGLDSR